MSEYKRLTKRNCAGYVVSVKPTMSGYNNIQAAEEELFDRLAELEDRIEMGTLVFIDEPFYSEEHQCWGVYQKRGDVVGTLLTTEEQAKTYKERKNLYYNC